MQAGKSKQVGHKGNQTVSMCKDRLRLREGSREERVKWADRQTNRQISMDVTNIVCTN